MFKKVTLGFVSFMMFVFVLISYTPVNAVEVSSQNVLGVETTKIEAGSDSSYYIDEDSNLWAWGSNDFGQIGDGYTSNRSLPVQVLDNVASVSAGNYHTLAIKKDGSLWAWGNNSSGQLGDGTRITRLLPVKIMENVKSVSSGGSHTLAIKTDGSLWAWGNNSSGQLGDATTNDRLIPIKVMENVKNISAGENHTLVISTLGSLWACGDNSSGQLGDGTTTDRLVPVKIMDYAIYATTGSSHSLVIKTDSSLWAWGSNDYGQAMNGRSGSDLISPVKVMENVKSVAAGRWHTLVLKNDGTLYAEGNNREGQLGPVDPYRCHVFPCRIDKIMDNVAYVDGGYFHSLAIKNDGSVWSWGYNRYGQLGRGHFSPSPMNEVTIPVSQISSISMGTLPIKTSYIYGESLNLSGATLRVTLKDNSKHIINVTSSMVSGYNPTSLIIGPQTVNVFIEGRITTFQVYMVRFSDVHFEHRNYTHINALVGLGIINGYSDSTFRPNNTLTRAQAAIMIVRATGLSTDGVSSNFTDVPPNHAAYKFISAANQAGIINGYSDGTFKPNANVTRAQIAIMVQRAFNVQASGTAMSFTDVPQGYAPKKYIETLASQKIVNGYSDGTFRPLNNVTRAQFSTMIYNAIQYANTPK